MVFSVRVHIKDNFYTNTYKSNIGKDSYINSYCLILSQLILIDPKGTPTNKCNGTPKSTTRYKEKSLGPFTDIELHYSEENELRNEETTKEYITHGETLFLGVIIKNL